MNCSAGQGWDKTKDSVAELLKAIFSMTVITSVLRTIRGGFIVAKPIKLCSRWKCICFPEQFCSLTCYIGGMFQSKFPFKDNKVLSYQLTKSRVKNGRTFYQNCIAFDRFSVLPLHYFLITINDYGTLANGNHRQLLNIFCRVSEKLFGGIITYRWTVCRVNSSIKYRTDVMTDTSTTTVYLRE